MNKLLGFVSMFLLVITLLLSCFSPKEALATQGAGATVGGNCIQGGSGTIDTAIGCVNVSNLQDFAKFFVGWFIGIGGGVAVVLIIYAGFLIATSSGNPKQVAAGKELLTAAISGLVLLIMSAYLLNLIGVDILGLIDTRSQTGDGVLRPQ